MVLLLLDDDWCVETKPRVIWRGMARRAPRAWEGHWYKRLIRKRALWPYRYRDHNTVSSAWRESAVPFARRRSYWLEDDGCFLLRRSWFHRQRVVRMYGVNSPKSCFHCCLLSVLRLFCISLSSRVKRDWLKEQPRQTGQSTINLALSSLA